MALYLKSSGIKRNLPAEGVHLASVSKVATLGGHYSETYKKVQRKLWLELEVLDEPENEYGERPKVHKIYTASLHEKSQLHKDLLAMRGRPFTSEELNGFDLGTLLGTPCQFLLTHVSKGDRTYTNIGAFMPVPKGILVPSPVNERVLFDICDGSPIPENLPDWVKDFIRASQEWGERAERKGLDSGETAPF